MFNIGDKVTITKEGRIEKIEADKNGVQYHIRFDKKENPGAWDASFGYAVVDKSIVIKKENGQ